MPRKIPTDPKLYREAVTRVRSGVRHRIIRETIDHVALTGSCEACGTTMKVYANGDWYTCANYYVDRLVRKQLKDAGEKLPPAKHGRLPKSVVQKPINIDADPSIEYLPWSDNPNPPTGFDPRLYPRPDQLSAKIGDYLDAQAQAQDHHCHLCGVTIRKVFTGSNTESRGYAVAMSTKPRGGHTQVRFSNEVFCLSCKDWLERANPVPAFHLRAAEILAQWAGIADTSTPHLPLQDPSEQTRIMQNHRIIATPIPE